MLEILSLILAIPLGFFLAKLTIDEKGIYNKSPYFPIILWVLAIASAIFFTLDEAIAFTLTFTFITVFVWGKVK